MNFLTMNLKLKALKARAMPRHMKGKLKQVTIKLNKAVRDLILHMKTKNESLNNPRLTRMKFKVLLPLMKT